MLRPAGDIVTGDGDLAGIGKKATGETVQQGRFSGTVGADHRNEIAFINLQVDVIEGEDLIDTPLVEIFDNVL
jgi:hypothetical protein